MGDDDDDDDDDDADDDGDISVSRRLLWLRGQNGGALRETPETRQLLLEPAPVSVVAK